MARAHDREIDQVLGIGADRGADIEHDRFAAQGRPQRRDRRPLDAGQRLEIELRHRHQRAGIAGGHRHVGLALLDRIDGEPHRRFPAAIAQRLARLVLHPHRDVGMDEPRRRLERRPGIEQRRRAARHCRKNRNSLRDGAPTPVRRRRRPRRGRGLPPSHRAQCGPCLTFDDLAVLGPEDGKATPEARIAVRRPDTTAFSGHRRNALRSLARAANGPSSGVSASLAAARKPRRLARIGIEPEDQELGGKRTKIDDTADQRLRIVPLHVARLASLGFRLAAGGCCGTNTRSTASSISLVSGSSVTTQFCPTVADTTRRDVQTAGAVPLHIEVRLQAAADRANPRAAPTAARTPASAIEIEMLARLGEYPPPQREHATAGQAVSRNWLSGMIA